VSPGGGDDPVGPDQDRPRPVPAQPLAHLCGAGRAERRDVDVTHVRGGVRLPVGEQGPPIAEQGVEPYLVGVGQDRRLRAQPPCRVPRVEAAAIEQGRAGQPG